VSPKHLPATNVEGSTIRRRLTSTYDPEATPSAPPNQPKGEEKSNREAIRLESPVTPTKHSIAPSSNREKEAWFFGPSRGGCFSPPAVRPRHCRRERQAEIQTHPSPTHQNSNRKPKSLETHLTPTKHSLTPRSNRKKTAYSNHRIGLVLVGEGRLSPPATAALWPSPRVQNLRTAQPNPSRGQMMSRREPLGSQALKAEITSRKTPGKGGKKAKKGPLTFVAIKNTPDSLLSASCEVFLISPCSD
jgi:hypothetical protein